MERLCDGLMSRDASVSDFAAETAADLLSDQFYDAPEHYAALQSALGWAVNLHGLSPHRERLDVELNPPEVKEARLHAAQADVQRRLEIRTGLDAVEAATASGDPEAILAELRHALPDVEADLLRVSIIERWREGHADLWLAALAGLALEAIDGPEDAKLIRLCLHWPLREGEPALVTAIVGHLARRFGKLDDWIEAEASEIDLRHAAKRLGDSAPHLSSFLTRVEDRRIDLLGLAIAARLQAEELRSDGGDAGQLALDLYRLCVPGEARLVGPVRAFMAKRREQPAWRKALLQLECMTVDHFGAQGQLGCYDFDYLRALLSDALRDADGTIADVAAHWAARLVKRGYFTGRENMAMLQIAVEEAPRYFHVVPPGFAALEAALKAHLDTTV